MRELIKAKLCYTELVYQRVNKKLGLALTKAEIEALVMAVLDDSTTTVVRQGKNYYASNVARQVQLTVNAGNYRLITVSKLQ